MYSKKGKLGERWYSDFLHEGERYQRSWGRVSKTAAKENERKWFNEIASGEYQKKKDKVEFDDFVVKYLKEKKENNKPRGYGYYLDSVKPLVRFFRGKELKVIKGEKEDTYRFERIQGVKEEIEYLSDIDSFMVKRFKRERKKDTVMGTGREVSGCTVNKSLKCLSNMFRLAKKWKMIKENPAEDIEKFKEKPDDVVVIARDREAEFFEALEEEKQATYLKAIALLAIYTGMRKREILDLEKGWVNLKDMYLKLPDTKNGEKREVVLTEFLTNALDEVIRKTSNKTPYVFPSPRTGKPYTDVRKSFKTAMKKAGFDHYKFHWLRHSFCSRMKEAGVDDKTIMEEGGWKTRSMVDRYSHPSIEHKRAAIEKIQQGVPSILPSLDKSEETSNLTNTPSGDNIIAI